MMVSKVTPTIERKILVASCLLTIVGLAAFVWAVLDPDPIPVMFAMSIGQGLGSLAFAGYLVVILSELRRKKVLK